MGLKPWLKLGAAGAGPKLLGAGLGAKLSNGKEFAEKAGAGPSPAACWNVVNCEEASSGSSELASADSGRIVTAKYFYGRSKYFCWSPGTGAGCGGEGGKSAGKMHNLSWSWRWSVGVGLVMSATYGVTFSELKITSCYTFLISLDMLLSISVYTMQ